MPRWCVIYREESKVSNQKVKHNCDTHHPSPSLLLCHPVCTTATAAASTTMKWVQFEEIHGLVPRVSIQGRKIVIYSAESTLLDPSLAGTTWQKSRNFKCRTKLSSQNFVTDVSVQEIPWMGHFARCKASSQMYKASGKIHIINCKRWWRLLMGKGQAMKLA